MFTSSLRPVSRRKCGYICFSCQLNGLDRASRRQLSATPLRSATPSPSSSQSPNSSKPRKVGPPSGVPKVAPHHEAAIEPGESTGNGDNENTATGPAAPKAQEPEGEVLRSQSPSRAAFYANKGFKFFRVSRKASDEPTDASNPPDSPSGESLKQIQPEPTTSMKEIRLSQAPTTMAQDGPADADVHPDVASATQAQQEDEKAQEITIKLLEDLRALTLAEESNQKNKEQSNPSGGLDNSTAPKEVSIGPIKTRLRKIIRSFRAPITTTVDPESKLGNAMRRHHVSRSSRVMYRKNSKPRIRGLPSPRIREKVESQRTQAEKQKTGSQMKLREDHFKTLLDANLSIAPLEMETGLVPTLSHDLARVLFNPGVYQLQDPRSRVFNFDPYLEKIMPVTEFDFNSLKEYITSSRDTVLRDIAVREKKKYVGSSSSMTSVLAQFHFLLSQWRPINTDMLSCGFPDRLKSFTLIQRAPAAVFLRYQDGVYAIDADKEYDSATVLMSLGKSMEKLLLLHPDQFERYRKGSDFAISEEEQAAPEAYHYSTSGDFLMRSQLDAYDPRLPGTGMFDLKTRAVASIRMDATNYEEGTGYQIKTRMGEWESYEREYHDMIRSAFLKYSLQVRMGRMDGIFVAFHNVERIFGFQYISLPEMDAALHGQVDTSLGDREFKLSIGLWNEVLDRATTRFPGRTLRLHFETRNTVVPFMYIFAEPVTEEQMHEIQTNRREEIEEFERRVLGLQPKESPSADPTESSSSNIDGEQAAEPTESSSFDNDPEQALSEANQHSITTKDTASTPADEDQGSVTSNGTVQMSTEDPHSTAVEASGGDELVSIEQTEKNPAGHALTEAADMQGTATEAIATLVEREQSPAVKQTDVDTSDLIPTDSVESQSAAIEASSTLAGEDQIPSLEQSDSAASEDVPTEPAELHKTFAAAAGGMPIGANLKQKQDSESPEAEVGELLGFILTVRNSVNGKHVIRPQRMNAEERWEVEYDLAEITDRSKQVSLYAACMKRRRKEMDRHEKDNKAANYYLKKLKKLSSEGRAWREARDLEDRERPSVVVYGKGASDVDA